jgi:hypothetical protein
VRKYMGCELGSGMRIAWFGVAENDTEVGVKVLVFSCGLSYNGRVP